MPGEENYASHDLEVLAPTVRELVSAFSLSSDAAWLVADLLVALGSMDEVQGPQREFCRETPNYG